MKYKWFVENGHIFSEEITVMKSRDHPKGNEFNVHTSIAFNVGDKVGQHIVDLHNQSLGICEGNTP